MKPIKNWNPRHFKEVDRVVMELGKQLYKNGMIQSLGLDDNNALQISFPKGICDKSNNETFVDSYALFLQEAEDGIEKFTIPKYMNLDISTVVCPRKDKCEGCGLKSCPVVAGAYIKYTKEKSEQQLETILSEHDSVLELSVEARIEDLIVTEEIKKKLYDVNKHLKFMKNNKEKGIQIPKAQFAFAFLGHSGTGKFEVAKVVAEMFYKMGYYPTDVVKTIDYDMILTKGELEKRFDEATGKVVVIKGIDSVEMTSVGTTSRDKRDRSDILSQMIIKYSELSTIVISGEKNNVLSYIAAQKSMTKIFQNHFYFEDLSNKEMYALFQTLALRMGYRIERGFEEFFYTYLEANKKQSAFENGEYVEALLKEMLINESITTDKSYSEKMIKKVFLPENIKTVSRNINSGLDKLVGMDDVKDKISSLKSLLKFNKKIKALNNSIPPLNLHMLFTGNPGTGKTSVARVMTDILYDLGYIKENKLIEVERKDLIAEYVGQTAIKTGKVIQSAKGGVLFIDEAYSITNETRGGYGDECIATLIKGMEDYKDDMVFIFAGYQKEMDYFLDSNSGLNSRIGNMFHFEDYTTEELLEIFKIKIKSYGYWIGTGVYGLVEELLALGKQQENFGNGRYVDNLIQEIILIHAINTEDSEDKRTLMTIVVKDIPLEIKRKIKANPSIGFANK